MGQFSVVGSMLFYIGMFGLAGIFSKIKVKKLFRCILIIIPPVILASIRYMVGYDYGSYIQAYYNAFGNTYESIIESYELGDPIAYYLITKFSTTFGSERIFLMILALFSVVPGIIYIMREWDESEAQPLMIFYFMFSPFIFSFSACKQGIALSFLVLSLTYVYERKFFKFLLCVVVAFNFHSTSLAFVLVYFFLNSRQELSFTKKLLIIGGTVFVIMNFELVLGNVLNGRYESYATAIVEGQNRTFWLYSAISVFLVLFSRVLIRMDERNELLIMMVIVGAMCQYLGFSNAFAKRIGEYFMVAQVFLLPQVPYMFSSDGRRLVKVLLIIYIVGIFYISHDTAASGMGFVPYYYKLY